MKSISIALTDRFGCVKVVGCFLKLACLFAQTDCASDLFPLGYLVLYLTLSNTESVIQSRYAALLSGGSCVSSIQSNNTNIKFWFRIQIEIQIEITKITLMLFLLGLFNLLALIINFGFLILCTLPKRASLSLSLP